MRFKISDGDQKVAGHAAGEYNWPREQHEIFVGYARGRRIIPDSVTWKLCGVGRRMKRFQRGLAVETGRERAVASGRGES